MSVRVRDRDHGAKKRLKALKEMDRSLAVGILSAEGSQGHAGGDTTVLEVAIWNEFGTSRIPERSFLRAWFDENKDRVEKTWVALNRQVGAGRLTQEQALERFGQICVGEIQSRIADGITPPNAPSTVARKGSSKPLIDTGVLRSSITYAVRDGR